jgi:Domain of unknown function (DUF397)
VVDPERAEIVWRKSSKSNPNECVEVAFVDKSVVLRHSLDPTGPVLTFTLGEWAAFLAGAREGEFDSADAPPKIA